MEIYPGFAAAEVLYDEHGAVKGVATGDMGIAKDGTRKPDYSPAWSCMRVHAVRRRCARIALAGPDGALQPARWRRSAEIWHRPQGALGSSPAKHKPGLVIHTSGWPLTNDVGGGSFLYHYGENLVAVGFVVHLNYANPHLSPYDEFQRFKTHPAIRDTFAGGKRIAYGARAINEGGLQSVPKLAFPGGALIGCSAGFVNLPRIKGSHNAMKTGMLGAEAAFAALAEGRSRDTLASYAENWRKSWVYEDLWKVRNVKPGLKWGLWAGMMHGGAHMWLNDLGLGALAPWTLRHTEADHESLRPAAEMPPIPYPKYDGTLTFDKLSSVFLSNTNHEENQPSHLRLRDPSIPVPVNLAIYDGPEVRYCPAGVYEYVDAGGAGKRAADQRAELRALQDLRHQGSAAEHRLGHARGRRRAELSGHVDRCHTAWRMVT